MDQRECHLQPLGICYKVYNFITKTLALQALKTVTLGRPARCASSSIAPGDCSTVEDGDRRDQGSVMKGGETVEKNATLALSSASFLREAKPPKKMVSINEIVEEIPTKKIKKKRSMSFQKSSSRNEDEEEKEEPKPLKSILKVGSDVTEKSYFVS